MIHYDLGQMDLGLKLCSPDNVKKVQRNIRNPTVKSIEIANRNAWTGVKSMR